jgi:hypothetical protein
MNLVATQREEASLEKMRIIGLMDGRAPVGSALISSKNSQIQRSNDPLPLGQHLSLSVH